MLQLNWILFQVITMWALSTLCRSSRTAASQTRLRAAGQVPTLTPPSQRAFSQVSGGVSDKCLTAVPISSPGLPFALDRPLRFLPKELGSPQEVTRAAQVMDLLKTQSHRIVDVELGVYSDMDSGDPPAFDKYSIPLGTYLEWLEQTADGQLVGKQLYLAQTNAS